MHKEPPFAHGQTPRTAVLFCNLGTPDAPTPSAVRRYLGEFLWDARVVEIPRPIWWLILHGIILRTRPAKSAAKYASIWTADGSPLKVWTDKQANLLHGHLGNRGHHISVRYAMRYGSTSIASQLDALKAEGATRVLILPAYPQYSATTTASVFDAVYTWAARTRLVPELRFVNQYHDHPSYITALAGRIKSHWQAFGRINGPQEHLVMSFHGVPQRTLQLGDPYHCQAHKTARLLAAELSLRRDQFTITFQSRLGRAKWLEPYTEPTLVAMARKGLQRVDVVCPGFNCDGLETLEEINIEAREAFMHAGGKVFHHIAGLNDSQLWINALVDVAEQHLAGWDTKIKPDAAALAASKAAALALGAKQ